MRLPVLALAFAAVTCDAETKEILIARGPWQLDSTVAQLPISTPVVPNQWTHLCLVFDKYRYALDDVQSMSVRLRRPEDTTLASLRPHLRGPDSLAIFFGGELRASNGEAVSLNPTVWTGSADGLAICLSPWLVAGTRYTALRLWSSRPLEVKEAVWHVAVH